MQPLDLNLASRPFKNDTLPFVAVGTAIVVLVVLTVWNIRTYQVHSAWTEDLRQVYSETRAELEQFERRERMAQREIAGFDLETLTVRSDKANEVIGWKAFSWTQLFNLLQEVLPADAQMVSIRPVFRPQRPGGKRDRARSKDSALIPVSVEGAAKNIEAFFALERALQTHPHFDRVDPEGTTQTRGGPVAFQLNFLYDPSPDPDPGSETEPEEQPAEVDTAQAGETPGEAIAAGPVDGEAAGDENAAGRVDAAAGSEAQPRQPGSDAAAATPPGPVEAAGLPEAPAVEPPVVDPDAAAAEKKPGPKPPGGRKGKRRGSGRGTEGTP